MAFAVFLNTGSAGGFFLENNGFFVIGGVVGLVALLFLLLKTRGVRTKIGLGMISCGGVLNVASRVQNGGVVDTLHIGTLFFNWADVLIALGGILVLWSLTRKTG